MNIDIIYYKIIEKLGAANYTDLIPDLENCSVGAATGSEALMATGFFLSRLQHHNPPVYKIVEQEVIEYLKYCKQNGLMIK